MAPDTWKRQALLSASITHDEASAHVPAHEGSKKFHTRSLHTSSHDGVGPRGDPATCVLQLRSIDHRQNPARRCWRPWWSAGSIPQARCRRCCLKSISSLRTTRHSGRQRDITSLSQGCGDITSAPAAPPDDTTTAAASAVNGGEERVEAARKQYGSTTFRNSDDSTASKVHTANTPTQVNSMASTQVHHNLHADHRSAASGARRVHLGRA